MQHLAESYTAPAVPRPAEVLSHERLNSNTGGLT